MKKFLMIVFLCSAVFLFSTPSYAFELGARGIYWFPSLKGNVKVDKSSIIGTNADLDDDLGIDNEDYPALEVFLGVGDHHLSLAYTDIDYSGSRILSRTIVFSGQTYIVSALVNSSVEYSMIDLCYQYDFLDLENILAGFSLGTVIQIKYLNGDISLDTTGIDEREDFTVPVPMVGLNLHVGILADILEARIKGTGITYSGDNLYEISGEISWTPLPFLDIHGGYKRFAIDIDEDDVIFDYDMSGPYITLTVSF